MKRPTRLSQSFVARIAAPGRYGDGRGGFGLSLLVKARSGGGWAKTWAQRVRIDGRAANVGLGTYPVVDLARARQLALENLRAIDQSDTLGRAPVAAVPTFADGIERTIETMRPTWKNGASEKDWRNTLKHAALLLDVPIDRITRDDVLAVLKPVYKRTPITGARLRGRIRAIMDWAIAEGHRADNAAGENITAALPKAAKVKRHLGNL